MTVYLVDMENIPHAWAKLLDACGAGDRFVLFYTEQVSQVPITLMEKVTQSQAAMDYVKCHSGPNGLDFQLVTEMGFRIARDPESEYVIVSQDHGFDVVVDYWADRNIRTKRVVPATGERGGAFPQHGAGEFEGIDCSNPQCVKDYLCWKLSNKVPKREIPFVAAILMDAMGQGNDYSADRRLSCRFTYLDRALRKLYGDSKGAKIRDQIKAVSREALILGLPSDVATFLSEEAGTEAPEEPAPMEAEGSEPPPRCGAGSSLRRRAGVYEAVSTGAGAHPGSGGGPAPPAVCPGPPGGAGQGDRRDSHGGASKRPGAPSGEGIPEASLRLRAQGGNGAVSNGEGCHGADSAGAGRTAVVKASSHNENRPLRPAPSPPCSIAVSDKNSRAKPSFCRFWER